MSEVKNAKLGETKFEQTFKNIDDVLWKRPVVHLNSILLVEPKKKGLALGVIWIEDWNCIW
jgi:hypothetical protein